MGKISLKVNVGGRTYPLTVNEEEQQRVLKAAEDINKAIKMLQENYAVKDMQDLLECLPCSCLQNPLIKRLHQRRLHPIFLM